MKTKSEFKNQLWLQPRRLVMVCASMLLLSSSVDRSYAVPGDLDLSFDPGSSVNGGAVGTTAVQGDGKVLIAGSFTTVHGAMRGGIARLNADGSTDETFLRIFLNGPYGAGGVDALAVQSDGRILIGGWFASVNGVGRKGIARLNADGSLDTSFAGELGGSWPDVGTLALQSDGRIVIGGSFTSVNGVNRNRVARLNADGSLDGSFLNGLAGPDNSVHTLALQSDGKIVIGGHFTSVNGVPRNRIARLDSDGSLDSSFLDGLSGANDLVRCLSIASDGKVLIGGDFTNINGSPSARIARLNTDGSLDNSFTASVEGSQAEVDAIAIQSDQKILIGGRFQGPRPNFARLNSSGSLDDSFLNGLDGPEDTVGVVALQADEKILVGGRFDAFGSVGRPRIARLHANGSLDNSFINGPAGPNDGVTSVALQSDGKVLVAGEFNSVNDVPRRGIARLNADGTLDTLFLPAVSWARRLLLQSDGRILTGHNGPPAIARLSADGSRDTSFVANVVDWVWPYLNCFALQADGKILIGGQFSSVSGVARTNLARLNPDGSLDPTFLNGLSGANGTLYSVALQSDGKVLIGGNFTTVNGVTHGRIARLNANGSLDGAFTTAIAGPGANVFALTLQADGKILVGGSFESVNGVARDKLARLNADGSLDVAFQPLVSVANGVNCLTLQPDGRILVAGDLYLTALGRWCPLTRLNADGGVDGSFTVNLGTYAGVNSIALQSDGRVFIGGSFAAVNEIPRSYVARLMGDYAAPSILSPPQSQTAEAGSSACLSVRITGSPQLRCQWIFNGTNAISEFSTNSDLELPNVQIAHCGTYTVVVTNLAGAVTSSPAFLNVIPPVERRPVPGIKPFGEVGSALNLEYTEALGRAPTWLPLDTVTLTSPPQFYFDLAAPLPQQRFYRAWQTDAPSVIPSLDLHIIPALTLTGDVSSKVRVDGINQFGPTDAWFTLDTVTLTNTAQLYFDVSVIGQPARLYRLVPVP